MTPKELRELNRKLAAVGRRVCEHCGENLELSGEHFYAQSGGRGFYYVCIPCWRLQENEKFNTRYADDAEFRAAIIARTASDHQKHRERFNATMQAYRQRRRTFGVLLPIPPGMRVVAYDARDQHLRVWNETGTLTRDESCPTDVWEIVNINYRRAGYFEVAGWKQYEVLAHFEVEASSHDSALDMEDELA